MRLETKSEKEAGLGSSRALHGGDIAAHVCSRGVFPEHVRNAHYIHQELTTKIREAGRVPGIYYSNGSVAWTREVITGVVRKEKHKIQCTGKKFSTQDALSNHPKELFIKIYTWALPPSNQIGFSLLPIEMLS